MCATSFTKTEAKCPFVRLALYGKAEFDQEDFGFLRITKNAGTTPMSGIIRQAEYGEGRGILVCFVYVVVGVLVTVFLCASQITPLAVGLPTHSIQGQWLQKHRHEKSISRGTAGRTFIYSLEPWGGVRADNAERPLFVMRDVSILPLRSGGNLSTTAPMRMVAESETDIKRGDIVPPVQFLRVRNLNWITTS